MVAKKKKICGIPDDLIFNEILSKTSVKFLGRLKCVSKSWCNFIEGNEILHKTQVQWICIPPSGYELPYGLLRQDLPVCLLMLNIPKEIDMDIYVYSMDEKGVTTMVQKYVTPPDLCYIRVYNGGLICCYHGSLNLTVFNAITQESVSVSLTITRELKNDKYRGFEYGFDSFSKKHKVLTYTYRCTFLCNEEPIEENLLDVSDFEVLTLGGENPTWRPMGQLPDIVNLQNCVTVINGTLYWYGTYSRYDVYSRSQVYAACIISFSFAKEILGMIELLGFNVYFKHPLFEFEGSLCYVEIPRDAQQEECLLKLNVWMLKDNNVLVPRLKNITMSLEGTNFWTKDVTSMDGINNMGHISMVSSDFLTQNGELLMIACDYKEKYIFSYRFLDSRCSRMKIVGQPLRHPTAQKCLDIWGH